MRPVNGKALPQRAAAAPAAPVVHDALGEAHELEARVDAPYASAADGRGGRGGGRGERGSAGAAAAVLAAGGTPGKRLALPNARILIHQPSTGDAGRGQASDIEIQAKEIARLREWLEITLASHTKKTVDEIRNDIDRDKILTASEALEYGLIDQVLSSRKSIAS